MYFTGPTEWNVHVKSKKHRKKAMGTLKEDLRDAWRCCAVALPSTEEVSDAWATAMMLAAEKKAKS